MKNKHKEEADRLIEEKYNLLTHGKEPPFWELKENAKSMAIVQAFDDVENTIKVLEEITRPEQTFFDGHGNGLERVEELEKVRDILKNKLK